MILPLVLFVLGQSLLLAANLVFSYLLGQVNAISETKFSMWGFHIGKLQMIIESYKKLFPRGRLHEVMALLGVLGAVANFAAFLTFIL